MVRNKTLDLSPSTPTTEMRKQWAKLLYNAMIAKGWSNAELARRSNMGRQNISAYLRGTWPDASQLEKLASALGMTAEELLPGSTVNAEREIEPDVHFAMSTENPQIGKLLIRNKTVTTDTALKILALVNGDVLPIPVRRSASSH